MNRIYFWRVKDRNGRWYQTRFRTTEEHIRKEHPEAERIDSDAMDVQPVEMYKPMREVDEKNGRACEARASYLIISK